MNSTDKRTFQVQDWRVDPWLDEISRNGQVVKLEPRTMRTLVYLATHAGEVVSIDTLLTEVWGGVVVTPDSVYQTVATLRRTLGSGTEGSTYIVNVPRRGYRLVAPVTQWDSTPPQPEVSAKLPTYRRRRYVWLLASATVALVGSIGIALWLHFAPAGGRPARVTLPISIAVLPFDDLNEKSDRQYLAEGMTQELIDALSRLPDFRVIGHASSFRFPNYSDNLAKIGQQLGVAYLLTGNVRSGGQRLRIAVKINAASDGAQLWSQSLEGPLGHALRMEDDIAKKVSGTLGGTFGTPWTSKQRTVNPEAFAAFLRGIHEFYLFDRQNLDEAARHFETALDLDPHYDRAAILLAGVRVAQASFEFVPAREGFERARAAAAAALALNPDLADGHSVMAKVHLWYDWDWDAADAEIKQGSKLQPNNTLNSWDAADLASTLGRWDESVRMMEVRVRTDPMDGDGQITFGTILYAAGRLAEAEAATRKGLELLPDYTSGYFDLGKILLAEGRVQEAHNEMLKDSIEGAKLQGLAMTYHMLGRHAESDSAMQRAIKDSAGTLTFETALAYSVRGERDLAFDWLDRAYQQKSPALYKIKGEPLFNDLKSDPRYAAFLKRMNLPL
jgi:TolB-like protein/DNA-binding winged helix-turn-helix (wHTH) protein/cytochrome c-type biogenesis protein CcmH/NrfG